MVNVYCFIIDRTIKMFFIILYIFFLRMCFKIVFVRFAIKFNGKLEKIVFGLN